MATSSLVFDGIEIEVIVGLEVHVQLKTASKLFCSCATRFGAPPNTQVCPVCCGLPGALPVLNRAAIELSIATGLALNCQINPLTRWDRKNYFYPDLPKGYQTSQLDYPICVNGHMDLVSSEGESETTDRIRINRAHLEEDAGKSLHGDDAHPGCSQIDLNRAGTPLLEIVTEPDIRSAGQAKAFLQELRLMLTYLDVSDCNMQEGSLRCDANVNLRFQANGSSTAENLILTPIAEIKNLNSFRHIERAIEFEAARQFQQWQTDHLTIDQAPKQTRGWNEHQQKTVLQRVKEASADYRYFPCPDLIPYRISEQWVAEISARRNRLPAEIKDTLQTVYQLSPYDSQVIVNQGLPFVQYFQTVADQVNHSKLTANWMIQEVLRQLNESQQSIDQYPIAAARLADLLAMVAKEELDQTRAKEVLQQMLDHGMTAADAKQALGIVTIDDDQVAALARELIEANPQVIAQIQAGNNKAIGALIGQARQRNPNANPGKIKQALMKLIAAES